MSESTTAPTTDPGGQPELKRAIGSKLLLFFVIGDILGVGIYALTGKVAGEVGGAAWMAFGLAFIVALFTATSYAELVGKYPRAAGAALYTHRAFNIKFLTFIVAFTVMCSGLTSASTGSITFGGKYMNQLGITLPVVVVALVFIALITAVNFFGVSESVKLNVILTAIELTGLLIVIMAGTLGLGNDTATPSAAFEFSADGVPFGLVVSGAALAFFALVGFEDSVNMVEETKDPQKNFPRALFLGLAICGVIYMLVAFFSTALVPIDKLSDPENSAPLLNIVEAGAPWFPLKLFAFIALCAVANTALINMMMASRLVYGMSREKIIPDMLGTVHPLRRTPWVAILFTVAIVVCLVLYGTLVSSDGISLLGSTTALLLLAVFAVVNVAVLVLRKNTVEHEHYKAPTVFPVLAVICCVALIFPQISGRAAEQYAVAGVLLGVGILLWLINWVTHGRRTPDFDADFDPENLGKK